MRKPLVAVAALALSLLAATPAQADTTLTATTDAMVRENGPTNSYGGSTTLKVDAEEFPGDTTSRITSYLKFDVPAATESATLSLNFTRESADGPEVYRTDTSWTRLTWDGPDPARLGGVVADFGKVGVGRQSVNLGPLPAGTVSLELFADSPDGLTFSSTETSAKPQLILSGEPAPEPEPPTGSATLIGVVGDSVCDPGDSAYNGGNGSSGTGPTARCKHKAVSDLLLSKGVDQFWGLGDLQYENGTLAKFQRAYEPTYGRLKAVTKPSLGNHEARDGQGRGYYDYFGAAAGPRGKGYYSFNPAPGWHVVSVNTCEVGQSSDCRPSAEQIEWLKADLAADDSVCTAIFGHHPRYSSESGSNSRMAPIFEAAYADHAELLLKGHAHNYERARKNRPNGTADSTFGVRQIIVGTGGKNTRAFDGSAPGSLVRKRAHGALFLTLHPTSYDWRYVDINGNTLDSGTGAPCRA